MRSTNRCGASSSRLVHPSRLPTQPGTASAVFASRPGGACCFCFRENNTCYCSDAQFFWYVNIHISLGSRAICATKGNCVVKHIVYFPVASQIGGSNVENIECSSFSGAICYRAIIPGKTPLSTTLNKHARTAPATVLV